MRREGCKKYPVMALLAGCLFSGIAESGLIIRSGGMVYDSASDITWLQDMTYAKNLTEQRVNEIIAAVPWVYGLPVQGGNFARDLDGNFTGRMTWNAAWAWADQLTYAGHDDWRLPGGLNRDGGGFCSGWNCSDSEIGHLFYVDGGLGRDQSINQSTRLMSAFKNVQAFGYWLGPVPDYGSPYAFDTRTGYQSQNVFHGSLFAWAVRSGDVPEPGTLMLVGLGFAGLLRRGAIKSKASIQRTELCESGWNQR